MSAGLTFDHCYQKTTEPGDYERFESLGFTLTSSSADHPYSLQSRILFFGSPEQTINGPTPCLEFCRIRDLKGELAYARQTDPAAGERDLFQPGFSFGSSKPLEAQLQVHDAAWADLQPSFLHRNYDWTEGDEERRPGWNFLNFDAAPLPGVMVWITAYEASPARALKRIAWLAQEPHRNGVTAILGFVFDLSGAEKSTLSRLTDSAWHNGVLTLQDGMKVFAQRERPAFAGLFASKTSPFKAVILGCRSLARFTEVSGIAPLDTVAMARIESSQPESWDLLISESLPG